MSVRGSDDVTNPDTVDRVMGFNNSKWTPRKVNLSHVYPLLPVPAVLLDPAGRVLEVSTKFIDAFGLTKGDCGQNSFIDLIRRRRAFDAYEALAIQHLVNQAILGASSARSNPISSLSGEQWIVQADPVVSDARLLCLQLSFERAGNSVRTRRWAIHDNGLSTDQAFRTLVETVKDYAIFLLDTRGYVATWNAGAKQIKQYEPHEIIGRHFSTFYGKEDLEARKPEKELEICLRDGRVEDEGWRYRKDGTRFWANVIITAVYDDGVHVGFSKVTRDLSERKKQESRLIAAYEESAKLKSDFLANMSHEIRTPLHGVLSACTLLRDTILTEEQSELVSIMDESGQVLLQVINDILDYSKLASGSFSINSDVVGIPNIITSVVRSVQTTLNPAVHFELFLDPDLPSSIQGDPLRYRQILQNLTGNAAKFTEKGYIRVKTKPVSEDEDSIVILTEIIDTGIGISDAGANNLFTPFYQSDSSSKKRFKGTGLGLSISKSLAELMGGQIGYKPNPDRQGSIFWFTAKFLKIKSLDQVSGLSDRLAASLINPSIIPPVVDPMDTLKITAPSKQILLAEDNPTNQRVMIKMLQILGFKNIDTCTDGAQAVSKVLAKHSRPPNGYMSPNSAAGSYDLILMDINMPLVDGHDATKQLRDAGVRTPIIAMTAYALKGDKEMCLERGLDDYIPKPVERHALVKTLVKWLVRPQSAGRTGSNASSEWSVIKSAELGEERDEG